MDTPKSELAQRHAQKRALRQEAEALRAKRRQQRQLRQQEDAAFNSLKAERRAQQQQRQVQRQAKQHPEWGSKKALDEQWKVIRQQRQTQRKQRQLENPHWRKQCESLRLRTEKIGFSLHFPSPPSVMF